MPVSKIQSLDAEACLSTILAEKNGMFGIRAMGVEGEMILPVKLLMKWEEVAPPD